MDPANERPTQVAAMEPMMNWPWPPIFHVFAVKGIDIATANISSGMTMVRVTANPWYDPKPLRRMTCRPVRGDIPNRNSISELTSKDSATNITTCTNLP